MRAAIGANPYNSNVLDSLKIKLAPNNFTNINCIAISFVIPVDLHFLALALSDFFYYTNHMQKRLMKRRSNIGNMNNQLIGKCI